MQDAIQNTIPRDQIPRDQTSHENPRIDERSQVATNLPRLSNADTHDSKIHELRKQIRTLETISRNSDDEAVVSSGSSALDAILPAKGFARGTLIEWIAHSNHSSHPNHSSQQHLHQDAMDGSGVMVLAFAAAKEACRDGGVFVIMDQHRTFFPPAALALGFRSRQLVVIQPKSKKDLHWSLHQALNCPAVATVWAALDEVDEYAFRRFQLAAESSGCIGLLGRSANAIAQPSWSEMQLAVTPQSRGTILGNRIPANGQLRKTPKRHHKNFSANRFLQIELIRSHHGQSGGKVMIEIDSYYGDIRKAVSHQTPLQKAAASVDTEFQKSKPSTNAMLKSDPRENIVHESNHDRQQTTVMDSKQIQNMAIQNMAIQKKWTKRQKRILCLWFPNWPIQRLIVEKPELKGQWITLFKQDPRRGQLVAACSLLARKNGIKIGMPLSEAKSLAEKSVPQPPHSSQTTPATQLQHINPPVFVPHAPEADLEILEQLADECAIFSPIVGLEQVEQPSCIYLDITGLDKLFGSKTESGKYLHGEENIAEQISRHFSQSNYWPCISIASSIGLSWALRNTVLKLRTRADSSVQKQATGTKDPRFQAAIFPQTNDWMETQSHPDFVSLPVNCLRISNSTISTLHQLGVSTIGQLIQLPRAGLVTRLGEELVQRFDQAVGRIDEVIIARHKPPEFQSELTLDHPTSHHETIDTIVWREIENVCVDLKLKQEGALQVSCRLLCDSQFLRQAFDNDGKLVDKIEKKQFVSIRIGLFQPTVVPEHLMELIRMQLENLKLPGAVYEVKVSVPLSSRLVEKQKYLFDENPRDNPIALSQFVNRLSIRLGEENVLGFTSHSGAQPEFSFQYHRLASCLKRKRPLFESLNSTEKKVKRKNNSVAIKSPFRRNGELTNDASVGQTENQKQGKYSYQHRALDRPLRLLAAPLQLNVISVLDGAPACFHWQDQQHVIVSNWGPERIQTGWWRGPMAERDYWRVETESGNRFWLFRELRKNNWFLHGMF